MTNVHRIFEYESVAKTETGLLPRFYQLQGMIWAQIATLKKLLITTVSSAFQLPG